MRQTLRRRSLVGGFFALCAWLVAAQSQAAGGDADPATLVMGQYMFPPGRANPYRSVSPPAPFFWGALFDGLTSVDARGRVQPALALSWRRADDNTWIFRLRPDVTFSNGEAFTADTVVRNIAMLQKPEAAQDGRERVHGEPAVAPGWLDH